MADMQEQLQSILSNPEAMSQIAAMAQALGGGPGTAQPTDGRGGEVQGPEHPPTENSPQGSPSGQAPDLSALIGMLGGGSENGAAPDIDPRMIQMALRLYGEYTAGDNRKTALLAALKPLLKEERRETIEKAERCARLAHVIRSAMTLFREEGEGHV